MACICALDLLGILTASPKNSDQLVLQGEGPIHLIGSHCIDFFDNMAGEGDSEGEDEEMEASFTFVFCFPIE